MNRFMILEEFEFIIGSPSDRENLICEIYYMKEIVAEISHEKNEFMLELYPNPANQYWNIPLLKFQKALEIAKDHLIGLASLSQ